MGSNSGLKTSPSWSSALQALRDEQSPFCRQGYLLLWPGWQVLSTENVVLQHYCTQKNPILYVWNCCISIKAPVRFTPLSIQHTCKTLMQALTAAISMITQGGSSHLCKPWLRARNCIDFSVSLIACSHLTIQNGAPQPAYYLKNLSFSRNTCFYNTKLCCHRFLADTQKLNLCCSFRCLLLEMGTSTVSSTHMGRSRQSRRWKQDLHHSPQ